MLKKLFDIQNFLENLDFYLLSLNLPDFFSIVYPPLKSMREDMQKPHLPPSLTLSSMCRIVLGARSIVICE